MPETSIGSYKVEKMPVFVICNNFIKSIYLYGVIGEQAVKVTRALH